MEDKKAYITKDSGDHASNPVREDFARNAEAVVTSSAEQRHKMNV